MRYYPSFAARYPVFPFYCNESVAILVFFLFLFSRGYVYRLEVRGKSRETQDWHRQRQPPRPTPEILPHTWILTVRCYMALGFPLTGSGLYLTGYISSHSLFYRSEDSGLDWTFSKSSTLCVPEAFLEQTISSDVRLDDVSHLMSDVHRCEIKLCWGYQIR